MKLPFLSAKLQKRAAQFAVTIPVIGLATFTLSAAVIDPGVRGGLNNTGGGLQQQGIPIPHQPFISPNPNPAFNLPANADLANQEKLFLEGVNRAGQLEATCDTCSVPPTGVGDGNPADAAHGVVGLQELDPFFPQMHTNSNGLGTRHNGDQCLVCHGQPILGGAGGFIAANKGFTAQNPAFDLVPHRFGKHNTVPSFITQFGPIREARFVRNPDGTADGSVHQLYVTTGETTDFPNPNCAAQQPNFAAQQSQANVSLRIPLEILGLGLIESIQDEEILDHLTDPNTISQRQALGIAGHPNLSGNDNTITRFGWKAQNKSMAIFAGEAYNVEMGVTNENFPTSTDEDPLCSNGKAEANDSTRTDPTDADNHAFNNPLHELPDWMEFMLMMRFTDGPQPAAQPSASAQNGQKFFVSTGCAICHTPTMQTAPLLDALVLQSRPVNLYSDLLLHHMGPRLADNIVQGHAQGDEFRSVPLWGVGQRIFFLHDGRAKNLIDAIEFHAANQAVLDPDTSLPAASTPVTAAGSTSAGSNAIGPICDTASCSPPTPVSSFYPPSEATKTIANFNALSDTNKQAIIDFLRSL